MNIEISKTFMIGGDVVDEVEVNPITFTKFGEAWNRVQVRATKNVNLASLLQRERIRIQGVFKSKGKSLVADDAAISQFPIPIARAIISALDEGQGESGEVINDGDGVSKPLLYRLGTPIPLAGKDAQAITELEFSAQTYGQIEDVLAADNDVSRAIALIKSVASAPEHASLQSLPSWAVEKLSMADGTAIMRKVLPGFTE